MGAVDAALAASDARVAAGEARVAEAVIETSVTLG
jgi:hypothetical protein